MALKRLRELSRTPEGAALGQKALLRLAREKGLDVTPEQINNFLRADTIAGERERPPSAVRHFRHFPSVRVNDVHFVDLLELPPSRGNAQGSRKYLYVEIDLASRYVAAKPLISKRSAEVFEIAQSIYRETPGFKPARVTIMDQGGEFADLKKFLQDKGLKIRLATPEVHTQTSVVERVNQTLARPLFRLLDIARERGEKRGHIDWTPLIPKIVEAYNTRIHTRTGRTPAQVLHGEQLPKEPHHTSLPPQKASEKILEPGTRVRIRLSDKETGANRTRATDRRWSEQKVYVHDFNPPSFSGAMSRAQEQSSGPPPPTEPATYVCCYDHRKKEPHTLLIDKNKLPYLFYREELQVVAESDSDSSDSDSDSSESS